MARITLATIAEKTGLSKFAVSRALSGKSGVSENTRRLVQSVAAELGYLRPVQDNTPNVLGIVFHDTDLVNSELQVLVQSGFQAEAARRAVQGDVVDCSGTLIEVTVSIGVAHASHAGKTADAFLESADRALYRAKGDGRNICAAGPEANWTSPVRPAPARLAG